MAAEAARPGPLAGIRIVEFAGIGPAPFGAMLLADLGADVIRLDRPGGYPAPDPSLRFEEMAERALFNRSRRAIRLDVKAPAGRAAALRLAAQADALIEGYRPGTMERLGLGPAECLAANPRLVYARMTGWGQDGPLARTAGHDLNYIGISGALSLFSRDGAPPPAVPPLIGDMGGGGLYMAFGLLAALVSARETGIGQVVDAAIVDGSSLLSTLLVALRKSGAHGEPAGANTLDGGRHYYRTYRCCDGRFVAVGAIEPAFRRALLAGLGLAEDPRFLGGADEDETYCTQRLAEVFAAKTRDHWETVFAGTDACVTPVLSLEEAERHPHAVARAGFGTIDGVVQPAPGPRFSGTPAAVAVSAADGCRHDPEALGGWGFEPSEIAELRRSGTIE
jgi:alpha-methylacyl-CoA racemase